MMELIDNSMTRFFVTLSEAQPSARQSSRRSWACSHEIRICREQSNGQGEKQEKPITVKNTHIVRLNGI